VTISVQVLDHGLLVLDGYLADDLAVANAARVSFNQSSDQLTVADEGLINFLSREHHGTPFEHSFFRWVVKCPLFVAREWHRHRIGHCLPGSALVTTETRYKGSQTYARQRPIEELWSLKHKGIKDSLGRVRILPACQHPSLRVLGDQGGFTLNRAAEIYQSGGKDIVMIVHEKGILRCTSQHKVYTMEGWKEAGDLEFGDRLGVPGRVWREEDRSIPPSLRRGIGVWTSMQRKWLIKDIDTCYKCGNTFAFDELELDHVVPVTSDILRALDVENLASVCVKCHANKTFLEEQPNRQGKGMLGVVPSKVSGRPQRVSHEMTYDIEMSGPHHNFVADGVVVHNSYNEWSGRYSKIEPEFYVPKEIRTQVGKPGAYSFEPAEGHTQTAGQFGIKQACHEAFQTYEQLLKLGIAKEQARLVLPVATYTKFYWSCNARSLMHFLGLRNSDQAQWEIREYAKAAEKIFKEIMPVTAKAFEENGRVAP
jgi:thymidylate synthase (FAD)